MKEPPMLHLNVKQAFGSEWCKACGGLVIVKDLPDGRKERICMECGKKEYVGK